MERFARGDQDAVHTLYQRYSRPVFAIAIRSLGDRLLAEEVVQQTFLNAWRASARFDPQLDPAPWLYSIARRAAVDVYRRERRHREGRSRTPIGGGEGWDAWEGRDGSDMAVLPPSFENLWEVWEVRAAIDRLPDDERSVIHATFYRQLTHVEAAAELGIPVGTVKSRSYRAFRRLAGLLEHLGEESA